MDLRTRSGEVLHGARSSGTRVEGLSDPCSIWVELALGSAGLAVDPLNHAGKVIGIAVTDDLAWPTLGRDRQAAAIPPRSTTMRD